MSTAEAEGLSSTPGLSPAPVPPRPPPRESSSCCEHISVPGAPLTQKRSDGGNGVPVPIPHWWRRWWRPSRCPRGRWWRLPSAQGLGGAVQSVGGWGRRGITPPVSQHWWRGWWGCKESCVSTGMAPCSLPRHGIPRANPPSGSRAKDILRGSFPGQLLSQTAPAARAAGPGMLLRAPRDFLLTPDICIPPISCSGGDQPALSPTAHHPHLAGLLQPPPRYQPTAGPRSPSAQEGIQGTATSPHTREFEGSSSHMEARCCLSGVGSHVGTATEAVTGPMAPPTHLLLLPSLPQTHSGSSCSSLG